MQSSIKGRMRLLVPVVAATAVLAAGTAAGGGADRRAGRGAAAGGRDVPGRRRPRGPGAGDRGDRGGGRVHRGGLQGGRAQAGPGADGYFQPFTLSGNPTLGPDLALSSATGPTAAALKAEPKVDFTPLAIGSGGTLERVPVVFAGYGITAKDEAQKLDYDDYAGLDVKGKAVLIIRREPQQDKDDSPFAGKRNSDFATFRHKATNAFQHGAAAVLLVNDAFSLKGDKDEGRAAQVHRRRGRAELEASRS